MTFKNGISAFKLNNMPALNIQENALINALKVSYVGTLHRICHSNFRVLKAISQRSIQNIITNILFFTQVNCRSSFRKINYWSFFAEISFLGGKLPANNIGRNLGFSFDSGFSKAKKIGPFSDQHTEELFANLKRVSE